MKITNAHEDGVRTLYKFMAYPRDDTDRAKVLRGRVEALIRDGELYFPKAPELNDPFDSSPHFKIPAVSPDRDPHEFLKDLRESYGPKRGLSEAQLRAKELELIEMNRTGALGPHLHNVAAKWLEKFRATPMCCFSATKERILMWSYYSGGHDGVCIHFDALVAPFGNAMHVHYADAYPTIPFPLGDISSHELISLALLTKSKQWQHEDEYRLFDLATSPDEEGRVLDNILAWKAAQLAVLPEQAIVGVTVGANMRGDEIENILRLCHDRRPRIPVFLANCKEGQFALNFERIS